MRRLVELARKDETADQFVRATVCQLVANWSSWYGGGFDEGKAMLAREGYTLPEGMRMQDGAETPRGPPTAGGAAAATGMVLLGPATLNLSTGGKERPHGAASEEAVQAEMGVMREDLELLRTALQVMGRRCHRPHHNHTSSTSPRFPRYRCRSASRGRSRRSSSPRRARRATTARAGCSGWASCWARASAGR